MAARTKKRYAAERRFELMGLLAVLTALGLLAILLFTIVAQGYSAFWQTTIRLPVQLDQNEIDPDGTADPAVIARADYSGLINDALYKMFPDVEERRAKRTLRGLISNGAAIDLMHRVTANPDLIGGTLELDLLASDDVDQFVKGYIDRSRPEGDRRVKDQELVWLDQLDGEGRIETVFNSWLFTNGDSREPEMAGIWGAAVGSFYMMLVVLLLSVPLGVGAALYLEEFAPKNNRWVDIIEVNINNLAAVPSIVFGLLGLAVFLGVMGLPRSAPLVGGLTLTLMTLPTIVVATRAALRAVPPSIREGALGIGASKIQVVAHHVLPLALPGILTGTIIGLAQALGETAPLLMIGMVAFIVDIPSGPLDAATALPVQIFLWADSPERAFTERSAAAIMVLLGFLIVMNTLAVILRQRFQIKW
ncbi:MAG: phosphate ABC transporter permease PstA [Alphaproteobacteria bacterium]